MCQKSIYFKNLLLQNQKWCRTEYSFGKPRAHSLLAAYTFAVAASRLLRYEKLKF
jgi:hypothetical protein